MKRRQFTAVLGVLPLAGPAFAQGEDWPQRTVRIVCPFTPGGSQDNIARRLGAKLRTISASPSSSTIAPAQAARSPPTTSPSQPPTVIRCCWAISAAMPLAPHLYAKPPYNPFTDLETVAWIGTQPNLLCCHPELPARHGRPS